MNKLNIILICLCIVFLGSTVTGIVFCVSASKDIAEKNKVVEKLFRSFHQDGPSFEFSEEYESDLARMAAEAFDKTTDGKTFKFGYDVWNIEKREWEK